MQNDIFLALLLLAGALFLNKEFIKSEWFSPLDQRQEPKE